MESWSERVARAALYRGSGIPNLRDIKPGVYSVKGILITKLDHGYGGAEHRVTVQFADGYSAQSCTMSALSDATSILSLLYPEEDTSSGRVFDEAIDFDFDTKPTKNGPVPTFVVYVPSLPEGPVPEESMSEVAF